MSVARLWLHAPDCDRHHASVNLSDLTGAAGRVVSTITSCVTNPACSLGTRVGFVSSFIPRDWSGQRESAGLLMLPGSSQHSAAQAQQESPRHSALCQLNASPTASAGSWIRAAWLLSLALFAMDARCPQAGWTARPLLWLSTLFHELGHGLAVLVLDGEMVPLEICLDGSGVAMHRLPDRRFPSPDGQRDQSRECSAA